MKITFATRTIYDRENVKQFMHYCSTSRQLSALHLACHHHDTAQTDVDAENSFFSNYDSLNCIKKFQTLCAYSDDKTEIEQRNIDYMK
jgi:hypothetical protein